MPEFFRFQFVHGPGWESGLIAWAGADTFSHVDILLDDGTLLGARSDAIGGKPPGVQIRPPGYDQWTKQVIIAAPCTSEGKAAALAFAHAQIGKAYDKTAIAGFAVDRDWRTPDEWFCSELAGVAAETGGVVEQLYVSANKFMPGPLAITLSGVKGRTITVVR